jgi:hypothetical protein
LAPPERWEVGKSELEYPENHLGDKCRPRFRFLELQRVEFRLPNVTTGRSQLDLVGAVRFAGSAYYAAKPYACCRNEYDTTEPK